MTQSVRIAHANAPRLELSLIGDFSFRYNGQIIEIPPNSQRLVCYLALQGRSVRRSCVSGTLWFNVDECRASASLRSALWRMPTLDGLDLVGASNTHIWLNPEVVIDIRDVSARGRSVLSEATENRLIDVARELVDFGDDLLVGWYDDWVIMERERFRQIRLHALDRLGDRLLTAGRNWDALQVGLAAIRTEPLRESAHRLLVGVHLAEGNVAEAIRQYQAYEDLLRRELNAVPSPIFSSLLDPYLPRVAPGRMTSH